MQIGLWESLDLLPQRFEALLDDDNIDNYYTHPSWYRNFLATCLDPDDQAIFLGLCENDGTPFALFPLRRSAPEKNFAPPLQISSLSNFYTVCYQPIVKAGATPNEVATQFANALRQNGPPFDVLRFDSLPQQPDWPNYLQSALRDAGFLTDRYFHFGNWYENVDGLDYDGYLSKRPGKLRNTIKRRERKLASEGNLAFVRYFDATDIDKGIADYEQVHEASWKVAEPYEDFAAGLARQAASVKALRLGILALNDRPIAAQIWLVLNRQATIFKLSYDENFKALSPGTVLTAWMVKDVLETDQIREIDFGRGDDPYKGDWLSERRERWGVVACNPRTPAGLLAASRLLLPTKLKRLFRAETHRA